MITNEKYRNMFSIITIKLKKDWWCAQLKKNMYVLKLIL